MKILLTLLLLGALIFSACRKDQDNAKLPLVIATQFDTIGLASNTIMVEGLNRQITQLTNLMKTGRAAGQNVSETALLSLWSSGSADSILANRAVMPLSSRYTVWLRELVKASGNTWTPGITTGEGGVLGSGTSAYLFDENGVELEQLVEKSQFAGTQYRIALELLRSRTPENVQKALVLFGAPSTFPNSDKGSNPDRFSAAYAARRDKSDGLGYYTRIKRNFMELQAAAKADMTYEQEYQTALNNLKANWERALIATVINYCYSASTTLSVANPGPDATARALHAIGEAIGFTLGIKAIPVSDRLITDAQIDVILVLLNAPFNGTSSVYKFATESFQQLPKLDDNQGVIGQLKGIYGFTNAELTDFRQNWVNVQSR